MHQFFSPRERALLINAMVHARDVKRDEQTHLFAIGADAAYEQANDQVARLTRLIAKLKSLR